MHAKVTNARSINRKEERIIVVLSVYGRTILKWISKNRVCGTELDSSDSKQGPVASFNENGEKFYLTKCWEFLAI